MSKNSYAIFGLGSFGGKLAVELSRAGHTVLVCDVNQSKVDDYSSKVAEALVCDVSNADAVKELNVSKFDAVILGMSSFFEKQVLALTLLKQEGAKRVLAKAVSDIQERILYRLGADEVIQPEKDVAARLARRLSLTNISDVFEFKGSAIAEVQVPTTLAGRSLRAGPAQPQQHHRAAAAQARERRGDLPRARRGAGKRRHAHRVRRSRRHIETLQKRELT